MGGGYRGSRTSYAATRPGYGEAVRQDQGSPLSEYDSEEAPKVFISHHSEDRAQARLLGYQIESEQNAMDLEDNSPKQPYPGNWKVPMTAKIGDSDAVVVVVGEETHKRQAVKWEIRTAKKLGKPVYAVRIHEGEYHRVPPEVYDAGGKVIPWNLERIKYELEANN